MTQIIQQLGTELKKALHEAEEVWIAVALMNEEGLDLIHDSIPKTAKVNFVLGIGLPTHPKVFERLFKQELLTGDVNASLHQGAFYHPKLYLIKKNGEYTAFIGSANATPGGYEENVELSIKIDCNQNDANALLKIFSNYQRSSVKLTKRFIEEYEESYKIRQELLRKERRIIQKELKEAENQNTIKSKSRNFFIRDLRAFRGTRLYQTVLEERNTVIDDLRESLDYPFFENIDLQGFFDIWELGHILQLPKPRILENMDRFKAFLRHLIDEEINLSSRFEEAYSGEYQIKGVKDAFISKILTIHDPINCWIQNRRTLKGLEPYGLELPKGLTQGEKYEVTSRFLRAVCIEAEIENMAVLDFFLYEKANNNL